MRYQQCLTLAAFGALFCTACKKDKESDPPQIAITSPFDGLSQTVPDTFSVIATITDDKGPINGSVVVVNSNGIPIGPTLGFSGDGTSRNINFAYPVVGEQIPNGNYTLRVSATDGENTTNAFRSISVTGLPLRFRGLFATTAGGSVFKVDSVLNVSTLGSFGQDVNDAAISSRLQLLFLAGAQNGPLTAIDVNTGTTRWQVPNDNISGTPYFTYCTVNDDLPRMLIGRNSGTLHVLNPAYGSNITTLTVSPGRAPVLGLITDAHVLSVERQTPLPITRFTTRSSSGDMILMETIIDQVVEEMFQRDDDHVLVFGNNNNAGVVLDLNFTLGGGFEPHTFSQGEIEEVARVDDNTYLIALPTGIVRYTYNPDQVSSVSSIVPEHIAYDAVSGMLFASTGSTLHVLDATTGFEEATIALPSVPLKLLVLLNR